MKSRIISFWARLLKKWIHKGSFPLLAERAGKLEKTTATDKPTLSAGDSMDDNELHRVIIIVVKDKEKFQKDARKLLTEMKPLDWLFLILAVVGILLTIIFGVLAL